jgi:hypothetical protein
MRQKERQDTTPPPGGGGEAGGGLDRLREQASRFLAAGDEAINRALSSDSEAFLRANRQQGGE